MSAFWIVSLATVALIAGLMALCYREAYHDAMRRALIAEARLNELFMEHQEDEALARELAKWKRDIDPRIANASPEKIEQMYDNIFGRVKHSPASWSTVEDLMRGKAS